MVGATGPAVGPLQALRHSRYFETATRQSPCGHDVLQIQPLLIFSHRYIISPDKPRPRLYDAFNEMHQIINGLIILSDVLHDIDTD